MPRLVRSCSHSALAAARALEHQDGVSAEEVATRAMTIAADICVYTNANFTIEKI